MNHKKVLALSNSRTGNGGFLETALPAIKDILGDKEIKIAFIPFASVARDEAAFAGMVSDALAGLPYKIVPVMPDNAKEVLINADAIMTGGGNTFKLIHDIYALKVYDTIRERVEAGIPYIGWSAGANITGATICTTNDMPIIQPESFTALGFLPFQINPHYYNQAIAGHNGETRDQRLEEYLLLNGDLPVAALPEGTYLRLQGEKLLFMGEKDGILFEKDAQTKSVLRKMITGGTDISYLL